jgi:uridylate kinase
MTAPATDVRYKRILLKLSGEALMGPREYGLDPETVTRVSQEIAAVSRLGVEICLVIGGGNIYRGLSGAATGMERASADYMGMLATIINALAMQNALENLEIHADPVRVPGAHRFERLSYHEVLTKDLEVMDHSAISLARENHIPILVFSIHQPGAFADVVHGRGRFTLISDED